MLIRTNDLRIRLDAATMRVVAADVLKGCMLRADAGETAAFARELEHVLSTAYEEKIPDAKWRAAFPMNTEVHPGADTFSEQTLKFMGEAVVADPDSDNFPMVDVQESLSAGILRSIVTGYRYSFQDVRASQLMGRSLSDLRARAARAIWERQVDKIMFLGDTVTGLPGFYNAGTAVTVTDKGADDTWESTTTTTIGGLAQDIANDVHKMANQIFTDTKGVRGQNLYLMVGTKGFASLNKPRIIANVPSTAAKYLLSQHPWLKGIDFSPRLDTAGASSKERVVLYEKDPAVLESMVSQDFEQFAPQFRNLHTIVLCHGRIGGLRVHESKAVAYMDGTQA